MTLTPRLALLFTTPALPPLALDGTRRPVVHAAVAAGIALPSR